MSSSIRFSMTPLAGINKTGVINKDANGRYRIIVGGLNVFNSQGQLYVAEGARELFESRDGPFMRRVKRGVCKAELGHPKPLPGQSNDSFAQRVMSIEETRVCAIHHDFDLDFDSVRDENGRAVIAIISSLSPSGPYGPALERSLENPGENVCFSIRAFTDDWYEHGVTKRCLKTIVTFDQVTEPGIAIAEKFKSPSLESYGLGRTSDVADYDFSRLEMQRAISNAQREGVASESALLTGAELFGALGWGVPDGVKPAWTAW